jgi:hypothetical protein
MTGFQYLYDIRGLLRNYHIIDEDFLTERQIEFWMVSQRATWIKKRDSAYMKIDHTLAQVLTEDIISVDRSFNVNDVPAGYRILRTKRRLPGLINFLTWDGIVDAGPVDMAANRFNNMEYREAIASGNGRFNKNQIFSFHNDGYLYIISKGIKNYWYLISQVAVTGIFEDPRALGDFKRITGEPCWTLNEEYPISLDLWAYMKDQIRDNNLEGLYNIPVDKANDDNFAAIDKA